jgi:hypothetical protein
MLWNLVCIAFLLLIVHPCFLNTKASDNFYNSRAYTIIPAARREGNNVSPAQRVAQAFEGVSHHSTLRCEWLLR